MLHERELLDSSLKGKRVLVTGGDGFIGSRLVERLAAERAEVLAVDQVCRRLPLVATSGWQFEQLDLGEPDAVANCVRHFRPQLVYHLASAPDRQEDFGQVLRSVDSNLRLTIHVLEAFRLHPGELFVFADSAKVYGNSGVPHEAARELNPLSSYAIGKCASWQYCQYYQRLYGLNVVALRPTLTYGPGQPRNLMTVVVESVLEQQAVLPLAGGHQTRDPLYVDDAVSAYLAAGQRGAQLSGRAINVGGGREISVVDLVTLMIHLMGGQTVPQADPSQIRPTETLRSYCNNTDAEKWLGWQPRVDLETGLQRTIESLLADRYKSLPEPATAPRI